MENGDVSDTPLKVCKSTHEGAKLAFNSFVEVFGRQLNELGSQIQDAELTIQGLNGEIEERDTRIKELEALLKVSKEGEERRKEECEALTKDVAERDNKICNMNQQIESLTSDIKSLNERNEVNEQRLTDLRKSLSKANQTNEHNEEKIKRMNEKIEALNKVKEAHKLINSQLDHLCQKLSPQYEPETEGDRKVDILAGLISSTKAELVDVFEIYNSYSSKLGQIKQNNERRLVGLEPMEKADTNNEDPTKAEELKVCAQTSKALGALPIRTIIKDIVTVKKVFTNELSNLLIETKILEEQNRDLSEYKRINELLKQINYQKLQDMITEFKKNDETKDLLSEREVKKQALKSTTIITTAINIDSDIDTIIGIFKEMAMVNTKHILQIKKLEEKLKDLGYVEPCNENVELTEQDVVSMYCSYVSSPGPSMSKFTFSEIGASEKYDE